MRIFSKKIKGRRVQLCLFGKRIISYKRKQRPVADTGVCENYFQWLNNLKHDKTEFVSITDSSIHLNSDDPKIFAYYLPQYHAIPENDLVHGKGFTEWTNVSSCFPQFIGHYQPKIPYDVGFYNLETVGVMERQVELAKSYGLYGFCFHYYWFSGKKVMHKPIEYFLNSKIDFKFHFCWANENWSKLWDGGNKEVFLEQKLQNDDATRFFNDLLPYIKDERYEKVGNKPLLMIYNPFVFEKERLIAFMSELNSLAVQHGFDGFFYTSSNIMNFSQPQEYGFDAIAEFPPHGLWTEGEVRSHLNPEAKYNVVDINGYIQNKEFLKEQDYLVFKGCFPSWDNAPRKLYSHGFCFLLSDYSFKKWLFESIRWTSKNNPVDKRYIYINAWNEWAEGAMLEPTTRFGYKYLQIVKDCIEEFRNKE